ncbi:MAG TPA: hypothetical protein VF018_04690 [Acidobacteriaceae bacterium]
MTFNVFWPLVEFAARPLHQDEQDAVLGDSLEAGDSFGKALAGVLGLVAHRQLLRWRSWRPWFATFLLALPASYLLVYVSISVACTFGRLMGMKIGHWAPTGHEGFLMLLCHIFLLITWSWTSGFAVGSVSPLTLCSTLAVCCVNFLPYGMHLRNESISPYYSLLFVAPAIWGVLQGKRTRRLSLPIALLLASTMTVLTAAAWLNGALWIFNWLLICPAWFLVATARRSGGDWDRPSTSRMQRSIRA